MFRIAILGDFRWTSRSFFSELFFARIGGSFILPSFLRSIGGPCLTLVGNHFLGTPPKFNSSPLKNDGWKMSFLLGLPIFRGYGYVKFPGCSGCKDFCHVSPRKLLRKWSTHFDKSLSNGLKPPDRCSICAESLEKDWSWRNGVFEFESIRTLDGEKNQHQLRYR